MKHRLVGRLALGLAALALAAPALAVPDGYLPQYDGKSTVVGHQDGTDGYQPQLQGSGSSAVELRRQAPPGYVPQVYVTSSDSARDVAPVSLRGQSPVVTGGGLDMADAGIGAAVAFGGLLIVGGIALTMRRGYRPTAA